MTADLRPGRTSPNRRGRGLVATLRTWAIPVVGGVTPTLLIAINAAAFLVHHLSQFRLAVTVLAFVSGLMLNTWAGLNIYRVLQRRAPAHELIQEENQPLVLIGGMSVVIVAAAVTAYFCWLGLSDEADLPNRTSFLTGAIALTIPFLLQGAFARALAGRRRRSGGSGPAPAPEIPPAEPV